MELVDQLTLQLLGPIFLLSSGALAAYPQHNVRFGVTHRSPTTGFLHIPTSKYEY